MNYRILFPDGRMVGAGTEGAAVRSLRHTQAACSGQQWEPGGVCAAELEAVLFDDGLTVTAGDVLVLYRDGEKVGTFLAETPTRPGGNQLRILAYDYVTRLDRDLTHWLASLDGWPYCLADFAQMVCAQCGLTLSGGLLNAGWQIPKFSARGITGRQLMQWVCQAGARFCRADADGKLCLAWTKERDITLSPSGDSFYYQGGLTVSDYTVAAVDGVQLALTDGDVGVCWPENAANVLRIQGNYLLAGADETVAQNILTAFAGFTYTPCTVTTPIDLEPGDLFTLDTGSGTVTALAMTVERTAGRSTVTCTGAASRSASGAVCRSDYRALSGRVLELSLDLQGIHTRMAEFSDTQTKVSEISQDINGITARVGVIETDTQSLGQDLDALDKATREQLSQLSLQADSLEYSVGTVQTALEDKADAESVQELVERFVFDEDGLTISNTATGMGINVSQEQVAFTGGSDPTTVITPNDMTTTNLRIGTRLDLGEFSLFPRTSGNLSLRCTGG